MTTKICKCGKKYTAYNTIDPCPACKLEKLTKSDKTKSVKPATKFNFKSSDKPRKKSDKSKAMDNADKWASRYNRLNNSVWDNDFGYCVCYTCGTPHAIKNIDDGHFISRSNSAVRYSEINRKPQCKQCNRFQQGKHFEFRQHLIKDYGQEEVEKLEQQAQDIGDTSIEYYEQIAEYYKNMTMMLQEKLNVKLW